MCPYGRAGSSPAPSTLISTGQRLRRPFSVCDVVSAASNSVSERSERQLQRRFLAAIAHSLADWWILKLHDLTSRFGTSARRAGLSFLVVAFLAALTFSFNGIDLRPDYDQAGTPSSPIQFISILMFTIRSMVNVFNAPSGELSLFEEALQLSLRVIGPFLFAQALFALRDRVTR